MASYSKLYLTTLFPKFSKFPNYTFYKTLHVMNVMLMENPISKNYILTEFVCLPHFKAMAIS